MPASKRNIEDWDFREPSRLDVSDQVFLAMNFITIVATEDLRIRIIEALVDDGLAEVADDREHIILTPDGVNMIRFGMATLVERELTGA